MARSTKRKKDGRALVVTGGAGWLGRALLSRIANDATELGIDSVTVLARDAAEESVVRATWGPGRPTPFTVVSGDIVDPTTSARLLDTVDTFDTSSARPIDIVHTAGVIHPSRFADLHDVNVTGVRNITEAALVQRDRATVVHVSSNSPFGTNPHPLDRFRAVEPYNPYLAYGDSKMRGELALLDAVGRGLRGVIVRPPWFYGPFQPARQTTFFTMVKNGRFPVLGSGMQNRSMVFIENLVDGVLAARRHLVDGGDAGKGWWVADSRPYTVVEIVETVGRALRDEGHRVKENSLRLPDLVGRLAERADRLLQARGVYNQQVHVLGEMNKTIACDIAATTAEIGYTPRVELYEGMRTSIRWCTENGIEL